MVHVVEWDKEKKFKLKNYLRNKKNISLKGRLAWRGHDLVSFPAYVIPTKLLSYNFKNTRIRSELQAFFASTNKKIESG